MQRHSRDSNREHHWGHVHQRWMTPKLRAAHNVCVEILTVLDHRRPLYVHGWSVCDLVCSAASQAWKQKLRVPRKVLLWHNIMTHCVIEDCSNRELFHQMHGPKSMIFWIMAENKTQKQQCNTDTPSDVHKPIRKCEQQTHNAREKTQTCKHVVKSTEDDLSNIETRFARKTTPEHLAVLNPQYRITCRQTSTTIYIKYRTHIRSLDGKTSTPQLSSHARQWTPTSVQKRILWLSFQNLWWNRQSQNHWQRSTQHPKQKRTQIFRGRAANLALVQSEGNVWTQKSIMVEHALTSNAGWESLSAIYKKMNKNFSRLTPSNELCEFWRRCQPTKTRWHAAPNDQNAQTTTDARANKNDKNRFTHAPA